MFKVKLELEITQDGEDFSNTQQVWSNMDREAMSKVENAVLGTLTPALLALGQEGQGAGTRARQK